MRPLFPGDARRADDLAPVFEILPGVIAVRPGQEFSEKSSGKVRRSAGNMVAPNSPATEDARPPRQAAASLAYALPVFGMNFNATPLLQ